MTFSHALSTNNYGPAKFIVSSSAANGTHTTIASALTAASSGDTIFVRAGTYTENLTLKAGVAITAFPGDGYQSNVIILGNATASGAGTFVISAVQLKTNSGNCLTVSGSSATIVYLNNVFVNCNNNTGISYTTSSASSMIVCINCTFQLGTTGIAYYSMSSTGSLNCYRTDFENSGASTTASSNSAGSVGLFACQVGAPISTSSTGTIVFQNSYLNTAGQNATCLTTAGTGSANIVTNSYLASGTASAISVGSGTTLPVYSSVINSSNTNAITGAGALNYGGLFFTSTSTINTTTQSGGTINGGVAQAPSAGFIGQQIRSYNGSGTQVTASNTPVNITSISLTAGIWDVSGSAVFNPGTGSPSNVYLGISTTSATLSANTGDDTAQGIGPTTGVNSAWLSIPSFRVTLTSTTTVYLVANALFAVGTGPTGIGRISATRVG